MVWHACQFLEVKDPSPRVPDPSCHSLLGLLALLTAGWAGAVHRGDPEVGGASVEDDCEVLRWRADGDGAEVFHLQGREGREQRVGGGKGEGALQGALGELSGTRVWISTDWSLQSLGSGNRRWKEQTQGTSSLLYFFSSHLHYFS